MHPLYDIHTHYGKPAEGDNVSIVNMYDRFLQLPGQGWFSSGLHPWYLTDVARQLRELREVTNRNNILAIGECGLDKKCATRWDVQVEAFKEQVAVANEAGKPLIIHCVRAYGEVMSILKSSKVKVPVIFHGYNRPMTIVGELLNRGYYLSFGAALLRDGPVGKVFEAIPADRYFLETDDTTTDIATMYSKAAALRKTDLDTITLQVHNNFNKIFSK